jgi:hypothetical protein
MDIYKSIPGLRPHLVQEQRRQDEGGALLNQPGQLGVDGTDCGVDNQAD